MPRIATVSAALALSAAAVLFATPAEAQLNPLRRAKDKAKQAVAGQVTQTATPTGAITFDNTVLELNAGLVTKMIAGLQARARVKGADGKSAPELRRAVRQMEAEAARLTEGKDDERQRYNDQVNTASNCRSEYLSGLENKHQQDIQRIVMSGGQVNPQMMVEMARLSGEGAQQLAAGDTAAYKATMARFNKLLGIDSKADTAAANAACHVPTAPVWLVRSDSLNDASAKLMNQVRDLETQGSADAIRASGLTGEQYAMALERITAYVELEGQGAGQATRGLWKFSTVEEQALAARLAELKLLV